MNLSPFCGDVRRLSAALRAGEDCLFALRDALLEDGHPDLAELGQAAMLREVDPMWTCQDGRRLRVADMTDDHLVNTVNMLQRQTYKSRHLTWMLRECIARNLIEERWVNWQERWDVEAMRELAAEVKRLVRGAFR